MFFKNAIIYRIAPLGMDSIQLNTALQEQQFHPCGSLDTHRVGFVPPIKGGASYTHEANGCIAICLRREEKILPPASIAEALERKVAEIFAAERRKPRRNERQELKDEIIFSMLPVAFTKSTLTHAYIDTRDSLLYVDSGSVSRAEELISGIRLAIGSFPSIPITPADSASVVMTNWLLNDNPQENLALGDAAELFGGRDERIIRCKNIDLQAGETISHLNDGMFVRKINLIWKDSIRFTLTDDLHLKSLKFSDRLIETAYGDRTPETDAEQFDADFAIMTAELRGLKNDLLDEFGGLPETLTQEF